MKIENIKFRAKRLDEKGWVEGSLIRSTTGIKERAYIVDNFSSMSDYSIVGVDPSTVCQFTGENDMNGTEIYIGDIISNLETRSAIEVVWDDRLKRLDCKFISGANSRLDVPFGIFISRHKRIIVLISKFDKEE